MEAKRKTWKVVVAAILALFVVGTGALYLSLGPIIKVALTKIVPKVTGTGFEVKSVSLSLIKGELTITGVKISNPEGFKSDSAVAVGKIHVSLDMASLLSKEVHIRQVLIEAPRLTVEVGLTGANLVVISDNVRRSTKKDKDGKEVKPTAEEQKDASKEKSGKRYVVDSLDIVDGKAVMATALLGGSGVEAPIPAIHKKDIGKKGEGVDFRKLMDDILTSMFENVASVSNSLDGTLKEHGGALLEKGGKTAADAVKNLFK